MSTKFFNDQWRMPNEKNQSLVSNYSMDFDSASLDYIDAGNPTELQITGDITVSAWFKSTYNGSGVALISAKGYHGGVNTRSWQLYLRGAGAGVGFDYYGPTATRVYAVYTVAQNDGQWHHLVGVKSGSSSILYLDGVQVATGVGTQASMYNSSGNVTIGASSNNASNFDGQIDGVSIFDYALSSSQVTTLYGSSSTGIGNPMSLSSKPVAYYQLGDKTADNGANYLVPNNSLKDYVFDFDGVSQFITAGPTSYLNNLTEMSLSIWFNLETAAIDKGLISDYTSPSTGHFALVSKDVSGNDYSLRLYLNDGSGTESSIEIDNKPFIAGTWYNLVMTYASSTINFYVDGQPAASSAYIGTTPSSFANSTSTLNIGKYSSLEWDGQITSTAIWNTALTPAQATTLYNNGIPVQTLASIPQSSNVKAWYKLNENDTYNSSIAEWEINQNTAPYQSSSYVRPIPNQTTEYVNVPNFAGLTGASAGSWSFWYNTQDFNSININGSWVNGGQASWVGPYGIPHTAYTNTGEFRITTSNGTFKTSEGASYGRTIFLNAPAAGQLNKWAHLVCTYDGSNLRVYVNGEQVGTGTGVTEFAATGTLSTGNISFGGSYYFNNSFNVKFSNGSVWSKTLTLADIGEIYNNGQPKSLSSHSAVSNLVSWWTLENFTTGLVDSIGGYNATLVGSNSKVSTSSVSLLNGTSSGMSTSSLAQSNLSFSSGYSPYALSLDGVDDKIDFGLESNLNIGGASKCSNSFWFKKDIQNNGGCLWGYNYGDASGAGYYFWLNSGALTIAVGKNGLTSGFGNFKILSSELPAGIWQNIVVVFDGTLASGDNRIKVYRNGNLSGGTYSNSSNFPATLPDGNGANNRNVYSGQLEFGNGSFSYSFNGQISNAAIWNTDLTPAQVTEIYNSGVPSNLNTLTPKPISWWQLGSNSSFNANPTGAEGYWTCPDEIGTNDGVGSNTMTNDDIVNGPGYSSNGLGGNTIDIVGDAPYSAANGLSENIDVLDRVTDVPS